MVFPMSNNFTLSVDVIGMNDLFYLLFKHQKNEKANIQKVEPAQSRDCKLKS